MEHPSGNVHGIACKCGFKEQGSDVREMAKALQEHAKQSHGKELPFDIAINYVFPLGRSSTARPAGTNSYPAT
jgi:predicted small metal-binding protein